MIQKKNMSWDIAEPVERQSEAPHRWMWTVPSGRWPPSLRQCAATNSCLVLHERIGEALLAFVGFRIRRALIGFQAGSWADD